MGMHTKASKFVTDAGYDPQRPLKTYEQNVGGRTQKIRDAALLLGQAMSHEGLVRIYGPLEATSAAAPRFELGDAGRTFLRALSAEIERKGKAKKGDGVSGETVALLRETRDELDKLAQKVEDLVSRVERES